MKNRFALFILAFGLLFSFSNALMAQCEINPDVPNIAGIYPDTLFDAQGCEFYEENITFVLPRDTTVEIVPGQPFTVPFNSFTVVDVVGLPEGMNWICNKDTAGCFYDVSPDNPNPDTLGCVRIFGTPEEPGFYPLAVAIVAALPGLGEQPAQFDISLTVSPCVISSDCYSFELSDICTPSVLGLNNQVNSGGEDGFKYVWEIEGPNGFQFRSTNENPADQVLEEGGTYTISYEAEIDTVGTVLTQAVIESVDCRDLLDAGDIYWILKDTSGNEFANTSGSPINNAGNDVPIVTNIGEMVLPDGMYEFQVWDFDNIIGDRDDDGCADRNDEASVFFSVPVPDSLLSGDTLKLTNLGLTVSLLVERPISIFSCTDTFTLARTPETPEITFAEDLNLCKDEALVLEIAASTDSIQWYKDGEPLNVGGSNNISVDEPGEYWVDVISRTSLCFSSSEVVEVTQTILEAPEIEFNREDSTLLIANPNADYTYEWFQEGVGSLGTGASIDIDASGNYKAILVDTETGCVSDTSETVNAIVLDREDSFVESWNVYPNPTTGSVNLDIDLSSPKQVDVRVFDLIGKEVYSLNIGRQHSVKQQISLENLNKGVYFLKVNIGDEIVQKKIVLQ